MDADVDFDAMSSKPMSAADTALFVDIEYDCDPDGFEAQVEEFIRETEGLSQAESEG